MLGSFFSRNENIRPLLSPSKLTVQAFQKRAQTPNNFTVAIQHGRKPNFDSIRNKPKQFIPLHNLILDDMHRNCNAIRKQAISPIKIHNLSFNTVKNQNTYANARRKSGTPAAMTKVTAGIDFELQKMLIKQKTEFKPFYVRKKEEMEAARPKSTENTHSRIKRGKSCMNTQNGIKRIKNSPYMLKSGAKCETETLRSKMNMDLDVEVPIQQQPQQLKSIYSPQVKQKKPVFQPILEQKKQER